MQRSPVAFDGCTTLGLDVHARRGWAAALGTWTDELIEAKLPAVSADVIGRMTHIADRC